MRTCLRGFMGIVFCMVTLLGLGILGCADSSEESKPEDVASSTSAAKESNWSTEVAMQGMEIVESVESSIDPTNFFQQSPSIDASIAAYKEANLLKQVEAEFAGMDTIGARKLEFGFYLLDRKVAKLDSLLDSLNTLDELQGFKIDVSSPRSDFATYDGPMPDVSLRVSAEMQLGSISLVTRWAVSGTIVCVNQMLVNGDSSLSSIYRTDELKEIAEMMEQSLVKPSEWQLLPGQYLQSSYFSKSVGEVIAAMKQAGLDHEELHKRAFNVLGYALVLDKIIAGFCPHCVEA